MKQSTLLAIVLAVIVLAIQSSHAQDQVGAPKNLTPQIVKNAVGLVKEGKRYVWPGPSRSASRRIPFIIPCSMLPTVPFPTP